MAEFSLLVKKWAGPFAAGLILVIVALIPIVPKGMAQQWLIAALFNFVLLGLAALAVSFPIIFRAEVSGKNERKNERRIRRIVIYSYSFATLSLLGSVLPFIIFPHFAPNLYNVMLKSPVGIILGCSQEKETSILSDANAGAAEPSKQPQRPKLESPPAEISCDTAPEQWIVNIGGMTQLPKPGERGSSESPSSVALPTWPRVQIRGGLVIPLYFLVLSLIGGAISLTRRVPEYQRRYSIHYVPAEGKPKLDRATVREYLAFQIMQFVSAPLLAVVAYYVIAPQTRGSLVALGFTAGFASETILLMIRSVVEKLSPAAVTATLPGSVSGIVLQRSQGGQAGIASASTPVGTGVKVGVVGKGTLTAHTDSNGFFVINGVPPGEQVIDAESQGRKGTNKITVEAGKSIICHIEIV